MANRFMSASAMIVVLTAAAATGIGVNAKTASRPDAPTPAEAKVFVAKAESDLAAEGLAGWRGPLNRCTIFGNKDVGAKFNAMLKMGQPKPWPEALATFTGERDIDASAIADYFAPLSAWLDQQNAGQVCTR
jgi:Angiotensin-converting enzyme